MVTNIAHRGFSGRYPENTMLAFEKALELGVDAIEIDVQLSRDGKIVVFHDEELQSITGVQGLVKDRSFAELRQLDASGKYKGSFGIQAIPTLADYFNLVSSTGIITFLELKNGVITYPGIEERVAECIREYRLESKVILFSANHHSVKRFGELMPEVRLLFPFDMWFYDYGAYCRRLGVDACMPYSRSLTPEVVREIRAHDVSIYPWSVDETEEMVEMLALGVDGMVTNYPDRLVSLLRAEN